MNKLNLMLTANPLEFAAIFGEIAGDATTQAGVDTTGLSPSRAELARVGSATRPGPRGRRESRDLSDEQS